MGKLIIYLLAFVATTALSIYYLRCLFYVWKAFSKIDKSKDGKGDIYTISGFVGSSREVKFAVLTTFVGSTIAPFILAYEIYNLLVKLGCL